MRWKCSGPTSIGFAIVKPVDPDDPAVDDVIADWKQTPGAVGIRIIMTKEAKREPNDAGLDRIVRAAVKRDFPVNILCWGNVDAGTALIDRHPDTRFIIDHLAILQPRTPPAPPQPWADLPKVLDLAKRKNAVIKVSGACTLSREPYPFPDIWDPLARVFDAWGFERCLWGTDWTRAYAVVNYEQAVEPFLKTSENFNPRALQSGAEAAHPTVVAYLRAGSRSLWLIIAKTWRTTTLATPPAGCPAGFPLPLNQIFGSP
jgi:L-fuconolactonase